MPSESRICQNCHQNFTIESEDFSYYEKIQVPSPTFCFACRLQRKMARRNERTLYRRKCDLCQKEIVSMYPRGSKFKVYCHSCWWGDQWDPFDYGREYDFSKPFFKQFYDMSLAVPRIALIQIEPVRSPYGNHTDHIKDGYLLFDSGFVENCLYSKWLIRGKDILDAYGVFDSELSVGLNECTKCFRSVNLFLCSDCIDSAFLYDCRNCQNCFMSSNLRNKSYVFRNKQCTKEEYQRLMQSAGMGDFDSLRKLEEEFANEVMAKAFRKYTTFNKTVNSTGDYLFETKNVKNSFHVYESEDGAYNVDDDGLKDCYDTYESAFNCQEQYDCHAGNRMSFSRFCTISYDGHHMEYAEMCHNDSYCFGCIGIRDKSYCIFNKQYSKEDYEALVQKIKKQMEEMPYAGKNGRAYGYGEFFPAEISPFAYNETLAEEYFPMDKQSVSELGFAWREPEEKGYHVTNKPSDFPRISDAPDDLSDKIFECAHGGKCNEQCTGAFRVMPQEIRVYKSLGMAFPALCPNCRHYARLGQRNPLKLWHRSCMCGSTPSTGSGQASSPQATSHGHSGKCPNEFETSYAPERKEIVYCERCYNAEVV